MADRTFNYIIDDGGSSTSPFSTWATAAISLDDLMSKVTLVAGDVIAIGHNSLEQFVYLANKIYTSPSLAAEPVSLISCTQGLGSVAGGLVFQQAISDQVNSQKEAGAFSITFRNSWAPYGLQVNGGSEILLQPKAAGSLASTSCVYKPGNGQEVVMDGTSGRISSVNDIVDGVNQIASVSYVVRLTASVQSVGLKLINVSGVLDDLIFLNTSNTASVSGMDFSQILQPSNEFLRSGSVVGVISFANCKTSNTYTLWQAANYRGGRTIFTGTGPGDDQEQLAIQDAYGELFSTTGMARTGGATVNGVGVSWGGPMAGIETTAVCFRESPFYTEWIYGHLVTAGSKTFTLFAQSNLALTKDQIWPELEFKADVASGLWRTDNDKDLAHLVGTPVLADTSTWTANKTNRIKLAITTIVNTLGLFRMRVGIGRPSLISTDDVYIDPGVVVT